MKRALYLFLIILFVPSTYSCETKENKTEENNMKQLVARDILGNPSYQAISYGGYRTTTRETQPTIKQLKEDMMILHAMGIRLLRTYNVHFDQAENLLLAISELRQEQDDFEMYVMLGAWIDCYNAFSENPDHENEDAEKNQEEINKAVSLTRKYSDIVKIIAVGNEAMVKWAASYFVQPWVILKYVNQLQELKSKGDLPSDLWITSSDNFASWGGGGSEYHVKDLEQLMLAVDFISLHTYPMHDTHYNPEFWGVFESEVELSKEEQLERALKRSLDYAVGQYNNTKNYMNSLGINKPIHIGETGWASYSNGLYGDNGSRATDEFKQSLYYSYMREWSDKNNVSCFYFEAFDEPWKDAANPGGSENYFGLFTVDGQAKYALWEDVDNGVFDGLMRDGNEIKKTYNGVKVDLLSQVVMIPEVNEVEAR